MISVPKIFGFAQRFYHRLTDRVEELAKLESSFQAKLAANIKKWPAPASVLVISQKAKTLFAGLNKATTSLLDSGQEKISAFYNRSGKSFFIDNSHNNSKAWAGEKKLVNGRWSRDAFHLSLSNVGHLAGGIANNYSVTPEVRQPFVEHVVKKRATGQYDAGVFSQARILLKQNAS
ncbi:MAG: hypothetical protein HQL71_04865 [Magnetococcales bacterium]|nr:hypothetical protein [Magnetococcales bacterium]